MSKKTEKKGKKFFLYIQTIGTENLERQIAPINLSRTAIAMGHRAAIYYFIRGPSIVMKGALDDVKIGEFPPLEKMLKTAIDEGVELYACERFARNIGLKGEIRPEVKIVGTAKLNELAVNADSVITF
ncbi:MAG: DsrE family protein [Candidatus Ranarchaeia archaeon]|jgi:predicted peroxiredoxin